MVGIYKITNKLNNKCYIGQSIDIENRWKQHIYESKTLRRGHQIHLAINKDGIDNFTFEILEECSLNKNTLNERERYWIKYYNSFNDGYNMTLGGQGEDNYQYDPELIRQLWDEGYSVGLIQKIVGCGRTTINNRLKGYKDYNSRISHSRGILLAIKQGKMNHLHIGDYYSFSNEQKAFFTNNISVHQYSINGDYIASYNSLSEAARVIGKIKPGNETNIGRCLRDTNNQKLAYGYQWSKEKLDKLPPVPVHLGKLVRCKETGQIFHSTVEAAKWCGLKSKSGVRECCAGIVKSAGKHPETGEKLHWEYVE